MLMVYGLEENKQWDEIVRSFKAYDTYWLSGYVRAFYIHGDGEPQLFYYEDEHTRGMNVVMKRDIADASCFRGCLPPNTYFDLATPYGYGGWLIEGEDTGALQQAYTAYCREHGIVSEFVRFHPMIENHVAVSDVYDVVALGSTVAMDLASPEEIWANMTSKNRNMVRKAQKNGVTVLHTSQAWVYETFREIYNGTMDKDHADEYYYFSSAFYESVRCDLAENAEMFYALYEGRVIAASIMLIANGRMNYHLSGSLREYAHLAPTNLLLYEAACWGGTQGCKTLYLGGGVGSGEDSLFKFKRSFYRGENLPRFYIGKRVFDEARYQILTQMRKDLPQSNFFPQYRAK